MQACVYLFSSILQIRSSVLAIPSQVACNEALHATGWLIYWMRMETSLLSHFFVVVRSRSRRSKFNSKCFKVIGLLLQYVSH